MQTLDEKEDVLENLLVSDGIPKFKEISEKDLEKHAFDVGVSIKTADNYIRSRGIKISKPAVIEIETKSYFSLSRCQKEEFCKLYLENKNPQEISDKLRIDLESAKNYYEILDKNYLILRDMIKQKVKFMYVSKYVTLDYYLTQKIWNFISKEKSAALSKTD